MASLTDGGIAVEEHFGLVHAFARRFAGRGVDYEDLYGAGCVGLVKAAKSYDPSRGTAFSTYAVPVIMGEMKRLFRDDGTVKVSRRLKEIYMRAMRAREAFTAEHMREPTVSELGAISGVDECELAEALAAASPVISLTRDDDDRESEQNLPQVSFEDGLLTKIALSTALESLPEEDRRIIEFRYLRGMTQQAVAALLKTTQVTVSRREKRILSRLRDELSDK